MDVEKKSETPALTAPDFAAINKALDNPSLLIWAARLSELVKNTLPQFPPIDPWLGPIHASTIHIENASKVVAECWINAHLPVAEIEEVTRLATELIGDRDKAVNWLSSPNLATDDRPPLELLGEKDGYERVKTLLLRLEYGVIA